MRHAATIRSLALGSTALVLATLAAGPASAATCVWNGGAGNWSTAPLWNCDGASAIPGGGDIVLIDSKPGITSAVSITTTQQAASLTLDSGDTLGITNAGLGITNHALTSNGTITIGTNASLYSSNGALNLGGTGFVSLNNALGFARLGGNYVLYSIGSGLTVQGAGEIGYDQSYVANAGTISANIAGATLTLDPYVGSGGAGGAGGTGDAAASFVNTGLMQATGGGILALSSGRFDNTGGVIQALNGSTVSLNSDVRITGGSYTTAGTGRILATAGTTYLTNATLTGSSNLLVSGSVSAASTNIGGTFTNNGTVTIASAANGNARFGPEGAATTIGGTGTITLDDSAGNRALLGGNYQLLTIGAGQTVQGRGEIGYDQSYIVNTGLVTANVSGQTLFIDPYAGSGGIGNIQLTPGADANAAWVNNGTMQAANGGTMRFYSGRYDNANGTIRALAGSTVYLDNDARILGGSLTSTGTGQVYTTAATTYLGNTTLTTGSNLLISGAVSSASANIAGTFTNNGTVTIASAASGNARFGPEGAAATIGGTGTVTLDDSAGNRALLGGNYQVLTIGAGQTVQGRGEVGYDQSFIVNNGLVSANVNGQTLFVDPYTGSGGYGGIQLTPSADANAVWINNGTMQAANGGTLRLYSGRYDNTNGTIRALAGSTVYLDNDTRILGGSLTSAGTGQVFSTAATTYLQNVSFAGDLLLSASVSGVFSRIIGTFTNNGTVTVASGINGNARLGLGEGNAALAGTGTITLDDSGGNRAFLGGDYQVLTIGAGQTVQGRGEVGYDQSYIVNNGLITANVAGQTLYVDPYTGNGGYGGIQLTPGADANAVWVNNGTMRAANGGTMRFYSGRYDNSGGTIQALAGSTVYLDNDVRLIGGTLTSAGTGQFYSTNGTVYLQNTTLTGGSTMLLSAATGGVLARVNGTLTNNGSITLASGPNGDARIGPEGALNLAGAGTITLNNTAGNRVYLGGDYQLTTIGAGQTINGAGEIGYDQSYLVNNGNIRATLGTITIDPYTGSAGYGGIALGGQDANAVVYNTGIIQADNGGNTIQLNSGRYEQASSGSFAAGTGSTFTMLGDANLVNLTTGGVLDRGFYQSITSGAASLVNLRSAAANSIVQIGTNRAGIDTTVTLSGANSALTVTPLGGNTAVTIDQTLTTIAQSGQLQIANGRVFNASNAVANGGVIALGGGTYNQPGSLANSGLVFGNGTVAVPITNTGSVIADGGTLNSQAIAGLAGTIQSNAGGTLSLAGASGPSSARFLVNNGSLALGANNVLVRSDYQNANFGTGSAFNARANVTGSGLILAESATMDLSGPGLSGNTLNVGNVRLGGSSSTTLTITNNGTLTTLRGAVQSPATNTVNISSDNFVVGPNGGNTTVTLSYTGTTAGSLNGQTITVANNFDNVADRTLAIAGAAYNPAAASLSPNPIDLGATRVGGTLSGTVTITNTAPAGAFSESLAVTGATGAGGASGTAPSGLIAAGSSAGSTVTLATATSGTKSGTVTYALATDGTGTSGLARMALPSQVETVTGRVYQLATAQLGTNSVAFATVRQGSAAPTANVAVTNGANGALNDSLVTSIGSLPAGVTATSVPGALAGGQTGALSFSENTATAGNYSGIAQINFSSTDPELSPVALPSQNIAFSGTVTQIAVAQILKDMGVGTLTGSGTTYFLDLGDYAAGSGSVMSDLGVLNAIPNTSYGELLGGSFTGASATGYSFAGQTFAGLTGGSVATGNALTFNYTGLGAGTYTDTLTFSGFTRYAGLSDLPLAPIQVNVTARVTGAGPGPVPEPATWAMMVLGFGSLGTMLRRRRRPALRVA